MIYCVQDIVLRISLITVNMTVSPQSVPLPPIETPTLQDRAYEAIKTRILSLAFAPGRQLAETELASQLGISKTPVREALRRLEREDLVRVISYKGVFVTEVTARDVLELSEIRGVLVGLAAEQVTKTVTDSDIEQARQLLQQGDLALESGDVERWLQVNNEFHSWLLDRADNLRLRRLLANLDDQFHRIQRLAATVPGGIVASNRGHYGILDAMAARDAQAAARLARQHILSVGEQSLRKVESIVQQ